MADYRRSQPYIPHQSAAYKLSRSKIELFMQCPRCFWLDARMKISRPSSPPFNINKAIDVLFKKEFDFYRSKGEPHPMMLDNQIKAIPFSHEDLSMWRNNFKGVGFIHKPTNLYIYGAVDDIWVDEKDNLIVVDYKATAKNSEISIDADWQMSYKRQMEIYQWLLKNNGFKVSNTAYFIYTNARMDLEGFYDKIEFITKVIPYIGSTDWIEGKVKEMKKCLDSNDLPPVGASIMGGECEYCSYSKLRSELTLNQITRDDPGLKKQIIKSITKI